MFRVGYNPKALFSTQSLHNKTWPAQAAQFTPKAPTKTMLSGYLNLPWWGDLLALLVLVQITIAAVTIYLHRCQAHSALDLHPIVSHFFRFWLWLTTGMITKEWASIHRKHHAKCETCEDPHSPQMFGIHRVLFAGAELYRKEAANRETLERYGHGTPEDWIERNLYTPYNVLGVALMFVANFVM